MLGLKKYSDKDLVQLKIAFDSIFDKTEQPYFEEFVDSGFSYIATNRLGEVGAFILVSETEEAICKHEIKFLGVLPRYRRKGYAKALLDKVKSVSSEGLWLNVLESNMEACKLYETNGFSIARRFTGDSGDFGIKYIYGLACYHCGLTLMPDETIIEESPTTVKFDGNDLSPNYSVIRVCHKCRTRCES
jgi:GNAT superfamily N-acetyltransferase